MRQRTVLKKKEISEEQRASRAENEKEKALNEWVPRTELGRKVKNGEITSFEDVRKKNLKVMEPEIVDSLLDLEEKMVDFKKTTKVRRAGRMFSFRVTMLVGDKNRYIGIGTSKDKERFPAMKKALKNAKKNMVEVKKGSGSWEETGAKGQHSVPFKVEGKCGSVKIILYPAPKGTGLVVGDNIKDVFKFAGITDVWCKSFGNTRTKLNFVAAAVDALAKTTGKGLPEELKKKFIEG